MEKNVNTLIATNLQWGWSQYPYYTTSNLQRSIGEEIVGAYEAGIITMDEARVALKSSYGYTFEHVKTQETQ